MRVRSRPGVRPTQPGLFVLSRTARRYPGACHPLRLFAAAIVLLSTVTWAAPKTLEEEIIRSPARNYGVNLEWEDVGYIGILRMKVYRGDRLKYVVEVPEVDPQPGNLHWLDDEWAACESYLGPLASGFFYVHAPTGKGYLLEIRDAGSDSDWEFSFSCNDRTSSQTIDTVSTGHTSLFPILVRDVPGSEVEFFTPSFCRKVAEAVDAFCDFRRKEGFREIEMLSDADIRQGLGALVIASLDSQYEILYFPAGAASAREMLEKTRRQPVDKETAEAFLRPGAPEPVVRWTTTDGDYIIGAKPVFASGAEESATTRILARGRFQGASDVVPASRSLPAQAIDTTSRTQSGNRGSTTVTLEKSAASSGKATRHKPRKSSRR